HAEPLSMQKWPLRKGLGDALAKLGDLDGAVAAYGDATDELLARRRRLSRAEDRETFGAQHQSVHAALVDVLVRRAGEGDDVRAFVASERGRALSLVESAADV